MATTTMGRSAALALALVAGGCSQTISDAGSAIASGGASAHSQQQNDLAQLPRCDAVHGTLVVQEPQKDWWTELSLPSPQAVVKLYVAKSGCFKLLDRGKAFEMAQQERALAADGEIGSDANLGKGQITAADFVLVPDLVSKNADSSGSQLTAVAGFLIGGPVGDALGRIKLTNKTADVTLTLTEIRSSVQKATAEGHGEHTDWAVGSGGTFANLTAMFGADLDAYQNTEVGQVILLAYLDAYKKMLGDLDYHAEVPKSLAMEGQEIALTP